MDILKKNISKIKDKLTKTDIERKLKEATSNEHCHANVSLLDEISSKTSNYSDFQVIVNHCLKKLECKKEKWRKILKTLFLIEHILKTGSSNFFDSMRSEMYKIKNLKSFSYIDTNRSDKGETIREKSKVIVSLLEDRNKLKEEREKYSKWKNRIEGVSNNGRVGAVSSSDYTGNSSSYGGSVSYLDKGSSSYDRKEKEKKKPVKEESSSSESEDEKKDKKKKKPAKKEESDSSENEDVTKNSKNSKKDVKKEVEVKDEQKKKILPPSNISIKKPGISNQSTTNTTNIPQGNSLIFDPFENSNTNIQPTNSNGNKNNAFDDIFGTTPSQPVQNKINNQTLNNNQFSDIFSTPPSTNNPVNTISVIDFSANVTQQSQMNNFNQPQSSQINNQNQSKGVVDTQKLLNDMYNNNKQQNADFGFSQLNLNPQGGFPNQAGFNMYGQQKPGFPQNNFNYMGGMNQMGAMNQMGGMGNQYGGWNNPNPQMSMHPMQSNFYPQQPQMNPNSNMNSMSFPTSWNSKPNPTPQVNLTNSFKPSNNNNNDDDFREVEEEDNQKFSQKKGGLNSLLDPKLVNLNDLKNTKKTTNSNTSNYTATNQPNYNFNF